MVHIIDNSSEDMEIDPIPASDVQDPPDISPTLGNTEDEADLELGSNNLSFITDIGDNTLESTGKLLTILQFSFYLSAECYNICRMTRFLVMSFRQV